MWHFGASTSPFTKKGNINHDVANIITHFPSRLPLSGRFLPHHSKDDPGESGRAQPMAHHVARGHPCWIDGDLPAALGNLLEIRFACHSSGMGNSFPHRLDKSSAVDTLFDIDRPTTKAILDALRPRPTTAPNGDCWGLVLLLYELTRNQL